MMRMSVYITDIYFPGVGNVSNYNLQELNINLLSNCRKLLFIIQDFLRLKEMDWYSLKMCLSKIHGIYRLFYKLVSVLCPLIPYTVESRVKLVFQYLICE